MFIQKSVARGVAAVFAVGTLSVLQSAIASPSLSNDVVRILPCAIANSVDEPACSSTLPQGANKYQIDYRVYVDNPAPATAPTPPVPPTPVALSTAGLDSVFQASKWAFVSVVERSTTLTDPAAPYDGKAALSLGATTDLPQGSNASVTVRVEALIDKGTIPEMIATMTSGAESLTNSAKVYVPAERSNNAAIGRTCTPVANAPNKVVNGNFSSLSTIEPSPQAPVLSSETNPIPGAGFYSELPLTEQGFGVYNDNKKISIVRGPSVSPFAQQLPLPLGSSVNWLRHGGGALDNVGKPIDDQPQKFWLQQVDGLIPEKTYQLQAWFSNISAPETKSESPPIIRFLINGNDMDGADLTLTHETSETGDVWYLLSGTFTATANTAKVGIVNKQVGWHFNQAAVTDISLTECQAGTTSSSTATSTGTPSTTPPPTTTAPPVTTATSGGGGGGGAAGLGLLALLALPVAIRRKWKR